MPGLPGIPSVTEILSDVGLSYAYNLPAAKRDWYLARGQAVHAACHLDCLGDLDDTSLHPEVAPRVAAYRDWVRAVDHRPLLIGGRPASEIELISKRWQVCGHPDRVGYVRGVLTLIDFKNSVDEFALLHQLSAYDALWEETHPEFPIQAYLGLELTGRGQWRPHPVDPRPYRQRFFAAIVIYRARAERRSAPLIALEDIA